MEYTNDNRLLNILSVIKDTAKPDKVILFGSRAKNYNSKDSDYDLLVLKDIVSGYREISKNIYKNLSGIGAPVDIIVTSQEKYEKLKHDPFLIYNEIASHGIVIYERE